MFQAELVKKYPDHLFGLGLSPKMKPEMPTLNQSSVLLSNPESHSQAPTTIDEFFPDAFAVRGLRDTIIIVWEEGPSERITEGRQQTHRAHL